MPRLSQPSFKVVVKSKVLRSSGQYPVRIQANWLGQSEIGLGISLSSPNDFDKKRMHVKKGVPNAALFNRIIDEKLMIVQNDFMEKRRSGVTAFTAKGLLDCLRVDSSQGTVDRSLVSSCFDSLMSEKRVQTGSYYKVARNHVIRCYGDVPLASIVDGVKFIRYLDGLGLSDASKRAILTLFRAVWLRAVRDGVVPKSLDCPVSDESISRLRRGNRVQFLSEFQFNVLCKWWLKQLYGQRPDADYFSCPVHWDSFNERDYESDVRGIVMSDNEIVSRDGGQFYAVGMYLAMVMLNGLSPCDMSELMLDDVRVVHDGLRSAWRFDKPRRKTGKVFHVTCKRTVLARIIIEPWLRTAHKRGGRIFNITRLDGDDRADLRSDAVVRRRLNVFNNLVNPRLKEVFKWLNRNEIADDRQKIDEGSTLYSARHTFASLFLEKSGNISALCSALGRSANSIATYCHALTEDSKLMDELDKMPF